VHEALQAWAGAFYLLNKIFFSRAERSKEKIKQQTWRVWSWRVYLIGLPAWVIIFLSERNWMAAAVEAGGATSMVLGLVIATRGNEKDGPAWLDWIARIAAVFGIAYSLYDFGGITTVNQTLELGVVVGFLVGTYLLAKQKAYGYLWFLLMNGSNAGLMWVQDYPWLTLQQLISFGFVLDAYLTHRRTNSKS